MGVGACVLCHVQPTNQLQWKRFFAQNMGGVRYVQLIVQRTQESKRFCVEFMVASLCVQKHALIMEEKGDCASLGVGGTCSAQQTVQKNLLGKKDIALFTVDNHYAHQSALRIQEG